MATAAGQGGSRKRPPSADQVLRSAMRKARRKGPTKQAGDATSQAAAGEGGDSLVVCVCTCSM